MRNGLNVLLTKFRAMSRARRGLFLVAAGVMCLLVFSRMNGPEFKSGSRSVPESTSREAVPGTSETDAREIAELYKFKESPDGLKESNGVKEMPDRLTELQGPINEPRQSRAPEKW